MIDLSLFDEAPFDPGESHCPILKDEPSRFDGGHEELFDHLIVGAALKGASDITIQTETRPRVQIHGRQHFGMIRPLSATEVEIILIRLWGSNDASAIIRQRGTGLLIGGEAHEPPLRIRQHCAELHQCGRPRTPSPARFTVASTPVPGCPRGRKGTGTPLLG